MRWQAAAVVVVIASAACGEGRAPKIAFNRDPTADRARLTKCLAGEAVPTRELLERIELAAAVEHIENIPMPETSFPAVAERERGGPRDARRWPRRCAPYARAFEGALNGPKRRLAERAGRGLEDGRLDDELFELLAVGRSWVTADPPDVPLPPEPASPLSVDEAVYLVEGQRCRPRVSLDRSVSPPLQQVRIGCADGSHHVCVLEGEALDVARCRAVGEPRRRRPPRLERCEGLPSPAEPPGRSGTVVCTDGALWQARLSSHMVRADAPALSTFRPAFDTIYTVHVTRCSATGCTEESVELLGFGERESVAPLADGVVLVEGSRRPDGRAVSVLARAGPLADLGDASPVWVLDPRDGAELWVSHPLAWVAGPEAAVTFVSDIERGVMALRFDGDGRFSFVQPVPP